MVRSTQKDSPKIQTHRLKQVDNLETTVHVVQYDRTKIHPRVSLFKNPTRLLDWCEAQSAPNAINGGFFGTQKNSGANGAPLGELWIQGEQVAETASKYERGCIAVINQRVSIGLRGSFAKNIDGDLLEAGPLLLSNGTIITDYAQEGFSAEAALFDSDVTIGRAPRVAIACNEAKVWLVISEGRSSSEAGLTLGEMAQFLHSLGAKDGLNLDGGSASSLVLDYKLINHPRTGADDGFHEFPRGREIVTAITF